MSDNFSTEIEELLLKQAPFLTPAQRGIVKGSFKEWLEQKRQKIGNETAFDAGQETLIQELLKEVSL